MAAEGYIPQENNHRPLRECRFVSVSFHAVLVLTSKVGDEGGEDGAQDDEGNGGTLPRASFPPRLAQVEATAGEGGGGTQC